VIAVDQLTLTLTMTYIRVISLTELWNSVYLGYTVSQKTFLDDKLNYTPISCTEFTLGKLSRPKY